MTRALSVVLACLFALLSPAVAWAFGGTASFVEQGPVRLDSAGSGRFTVKNTGGETLHVNTIYARSNERDPRIPGTLVATFEGGGTKVDLAPGEARAVSLKWDRHGARLGQLFGHVVVESSDPAAPQRAIGVVGSNGVLRDHVGTWLVALPLLGALLILPLRASRRVDEKNARWIALVALGAMAALLLWTFRAFDPLVSRADGNDGFQFIERARLLGGIEWYLGIDGTTLPLLGAVAIAALVGVGASFRIERHHEAFFASYLVAIACTVGALLAMDAMLLTVFWGASLLPLITLIFRFGRPSVALKTAIFGVVSVVTLALLVTALRRASDATFFVDGTRAQSFAITELARVDWLARTQSGALLFGKPFVEGAFVALFVAAAIPLAIAPLHGYLADAFAESPAGAAIVVSVSTSVIGAHLFVRLGVGVLAHGVRWAAPALAALGAATVVWGALAAVGERDLRRAIAHVSIAHAGVVLLGIAACTPQGLAGAVAQSAARTVTIAGLLVIAGALHDRVRIGALDRLGGLVADTPRLAGLSAVVFLAAGIAPGTLSFGASLLSLAGAFPNHRGATALVAAGLVVLALACVTLYRRVFLGPLSESWRQSPELEPFGGRFPEADRRETLVLAALAVVIVLLGLFPGVWLGLSRGTIDDLDARVNPERIAVVSVASEKLALKP